MNQKSVSCGMCGRGLLLGERIETFVNGGKRHQICELCYPKALQFGWVREDQLTDRQPPRERGAASSSLWMRIVEMVRKGPAISGRAKRSVRDGSSPADITQSPSETKAVEATAQAESAKQPVVGDIHAVPSVPASRFAQAFQRYNLSEHPARIAGVIKTLGLPQVSVFDAKQESSVVVVIVAWEISWYRYEIDLSKPNSAVAQVAKGYDLTELSEFNLAANATVDSEGMLSLSGSN